MGSVTADAFTRIRVLVPVVPFVHVIVNWLVPMELMVKSLAAEPGLTAIVVELMGLPEAVSVRKLAVVPSVPLNSKTRKW